jgi:hypothetical protein
MPQDGRRVPTCRLVVRPQYPPRRKSSNRRYSKLALHNTELPPVRSSSCSVASAVMEPRCAGPRGTEKSFKSIRYNGIDHGVRGAMIPQMSSNRYGLREADAHCTHSRRTIRCSRSRVRQIALRTAAIRRVPSGRRRDLGRPNGAAAMPKVLVGAPREKDLAATPSRVSCG